MRCNQIGRSLHEALDRDLPFNPLNLLCLRRCRLPVRLSRCWPQTRDRRISVGTNFHGPTAWRCLDALSSSSLRIETPGFHPPCIICSVLVRLVLLRPYQTEESKSEAGFSGWLELILVSWLRSRRALCRSLREQISVSASRTNQEV